MLESNHCDEPEAHLISVKKPQDGTFEWIKDRPGVIDLESAGASRLVPITGMPGSGKSVLAASLFNKFRQAMGFDHKAFYACNGRDASRRTARSLMSSLLAQILRTKTKKLPEHLLTEIFDGIPLPVNFDAIEPIATIFSKTCRLLRTRILIVVDALDECDPGKDRENLIHLITEVIRNGGDTPITAIVLCRPYWDLAFEDLDAKSRFHIDLDGEPRVQEDLRLFTAEMVKDFVKKRTGYASLEDVILAEIFNRARGSHGGMFLMVELLIDLLLRATNSSLRATRDTIDSLPDTVEEIYQRIWESIDECSRESARHMMTWILTMFGPVQVSDLADALAHEPFLSGDNEISDAAVDEARPRDMANDLRRLLGPFIRITVEFRREVVRVTHQTVKEYFEGPESKHAKARAMRPSLEGDFHIHVARVCLVSLILCGREPDVDPSHDERDRPVSLQSSTWTVVKGGTRGFHFYARTKCIRHREAAHLAGESQPKIEEFDVLFGRTVRNAELWLQAPS